MAGMQWDSFLHSPRFEGSTESYISTSSLEYVNAQLVAHGFASPPGLSLDGLSGTDSDRLVKCLLYMLSHRLQDMSRTEELSAKFRTLTYDHERLLTMHRSANEKLATAEKEVNLYKTKLTAAQRALESSELSHKQTTAELQRTRAALQGIRATHQQELKKKDKELERMTSKWNKLSDAQIKLSTVPAGLKCANVGIVHGSELIPKTPSLLDTALDDAEKVREQLIEEVGRLRRLVVKVVNQIQAVLFHVQGFVTDKNEQSIEHSVTTLFPMYPPTHAHDVLSATLRSLRDTLTALPLHIASAPMRSSSTSTSIKTSESVDPKTEEIARLHATIAQLKQEIDQTHTQAQNQASQNQALFNNFVVPQQETPPDAAEMSTELMTTSMADAERERLEKIRQELDNEREKFTQAAVQLGRERTALEADRVRLLEEKRSWEVQQMLDDLPPTPDPHLHPQSHPPQAPDVQQMPRKSPRKPKVTIHHSFSKQSPRKLRSRKRQPSTSLSSAGRKAKRTSYRPSTTPVESTTSSACEIIAVVDEVPGTPQQQYLPSIFPPPPPLAVPSSSLNPPTSMASILHSPFVLPPPSPEASLPRQPLFPPSSSLQFQSITQPDFLMTHLPPPTPINESTPFPGMKALLHPHSQAQTQIQEGTVTPVKRLFPNKPLPLPQRVIHAYSPVKPSPLSRILMLSHSPDTPFYEGGAPSITAARQLDIVHEENEIDNAEKIYFEVESPAIQLAQSQNQGLLLETPQHQQGPEHRQMSLAAELGVESPPDIVEIVAIDEEQEREEPSKKKRKTGNSGNGQHVMLDRENGEPSIGVGVRTKKPAVGAGVKARPKSKTAGSHKASTGVSRGGGGHGGVEKENGDVASRRIGRSSSSTSAPARTVVAKGTRMSTRTKVSVSASSKGDPSTAGPRRVPINSVEAPVIGRNS